MIRSLRRSFPLPVLTRDSAPNASYQTRCPVPLLFCPTRVAPTINRNVTSLRRSHRANHRSRASCPDLSRRSAPVLLKARKARGPCYVAFLSDHFFPLPHAGTPQSMAIAPARRSSLLIVEDHALFERLQLPEGTLYSVRFSVRAWRYTDFSLPRAIGSVHRRTQTEFARF